MEVSIVSEESSFSSGVYWGTLLLLSPLVCFKHNENSLREGRTQER